MTETNERGVAEDVSYYVRALWRNDEDTGQHLARMSQYSALLYQLCGFDAAACERMRQASMLHDIGKLHIPNAILKKPGQLNASEWRVMRQHPISGYRLLKDHPSPILQLGASIALSHHERWDGSGYPAGQQGETIPLEGRIVALADVFDALMSQRCYKVAWPIDKVIAKLESEKGRHFDPDLVDVFLENLSAFLAI